MESLKELIDQRNKAVADARKVLDTADTEKRSLSAEDNAVYEKADKEVDRLNDQIEKRRSLSGRQTAPTKINVTDQDHLDYINVKLGNRGDWKIPKASEDFKRTTPDYAAKLNAYMVADSRAVAQREALGLSVGKDNKGGYLTTTQMASQLIKFLDDSVFMRGLSTVISIGNAVSLGALSWDTDPANATWGAEVPASDLSEDDTATVGAREMTPHLMTLYLKVSRKLLRASVLPIESLLMQRAAYKFGITEETAYLTGSGAQRPLGVFIASDNGISTSRDTTCSGTSDFTVDELIDVLYSLKAQYQANATWLVHRTFVKMLRKKKSGDGQYLWQPAITAGQPDTILNRPVAMNENAPSTFTTGQYIALVGDFKTGYWIVDSLEMELQRLDELLALRNQVGFVMRKETDAMPVLGECFGRLKLG